MAPLFIFSDDDLLLAAFGLPAAAAQPPVLPAWQLNDPSAAPGLINAAASISSCPGGNFSAPAGATPSSAMPTAGAPAGFKVQLGGPPIRTATIAGLPASAPAGHEALLAQRY